VIVTSGRGIFFATAGTRGITRCGGRGGCAGRYRNSRGLSAKFKIAAGEIIKGTFVFKKDHLAKLLPAQLKADGYLGHLGVTNVIALGIDLALTVSAAYTNTAFSDARKYGIAIAIVEEFATTHGISKQLNCVSVLIRPNRAGDKRAEQKYYSMQTGSITHCLSPDVIAASSTDAAKLRPNQVYEAGIEKARVSFR